MRNGTWPLRFGLAAGVVVAMLAGTTAPTMAQHRGGGGSMPQWQTMPHVSHAYRGSGWSDRNRHFGGRDDWRRPDWRYRSSFNHGDFDHWSHGRWFHGRHGDRFGWWWTLGDDWYAYDQPIYPYPDYDPDDTPPPYYYDPNATQATAQPAPPPPPAAAPGQPSLVYDPYTNQYKPEGGAQSYYYCYNPAGYYPNVTDCPSGWVARPPG